jgi:hypothetical protein
MGSAMTMNLDGLLQERIVEYLVPQPLVDHGSAPTVRPLIEWWTDRGL